MEDRTILKTPLVVSKLDRLLRDTAFTAKMMAEQVKFIVLDAGKDAEPFILRVRAAMVKEERHVESLLERRTRWTG